MLIGRPPKPSGSSKQPREIDKDFTSSAGDTFSSCTGSSGARGGGGSIVCSARMASSGAISAVACARMMCH